MSITSKLWKLIYWPICRMYSRRLQDNAADTLMCLLVGIYFYSVHRYWPNFKKPRSFSEKVCNRMLFDRNPQWTMLSDKFGVRDFVANKIGTEYLIPLLWAGVDSEKIPFDELPQKYVIKASHGCGYNIIVKDKKKVNSKTTIHLLKKWIGENFWRDRVIGNAWAYKNIKPTIIVEAFLECNGNIPEDFKFFCFSGRVEMIQVSFDRYGDASEKLLDRTFSPLPLWNGLKLYQGSVLRPDNFEGMVKVAESLARDLDFIRVDLYNVSGRIYFGELTCYPAGGLARFIPRNYDYTLGDKWLIK
jgi:hypothetical protein